jgi:hypothetical protein
MTLSRTIVTSSAPARPTVSPNTPPRLSPDAPRGTRLLAIASYGGAVQQGGFYIMEAIFPNHQNREGWPGFVNIREHEGTFPADIFVVAEDQVEWNGPIRRTGASRLTAAAQPIEGLRLEFLRGGYVNFASRERPPTAIFGDLQHAVREAERLSLETTGAPVLTCRVESVVRRVLTLETF